MFEVGSVLHLMEPCTNLVTKLKLAFFVDNSEIGSNEMGNDLF